uniref:Condensin-2 complex subunit H2 n=2 Tax=Populus alba TaxID=43335 RepID=A0A4U5NRB4_POPAL|nr:hypothetical protein D5086_0000239710 [Populus alba]
MINNNKEEASKYHTVQAERDLEANWEVDLSKKLEDYLLKICSGEIAGNEEDTALLLQGSVQVYSRKAAGAIRGHICPELNKVVPVQFSDEENDEFWVSDDVPGDCLDSSGDGGELESYLLATNDLYQDFILLDPCDALAINDFLKADDTGRAQNGPYRGSSILLELMVVRSGLTLLSMIIFDENPGFEMEDRYSDPENAEDSDDIKDFRRNGLQSAEKTSITALFSNCKDAMVLLVQSLPKYGKHSKTKLETMGNTRSPTLYEKLRQSLTNEGHNIPDTTGNSGNDNEDNAYDTGIPDFGQPDEEISECMNEDSSPPLHEKHDDGGTHFDTYKDFGHGDQRSQASLEDLCRSHLDALLANIAETEKQTELAARVSSWKLKIEQNLEEQDFDKLSLETDSQKHVMAFTDVVKGQEKHDVARTFSALLQLVNNGEVDFDRSQANTESFCYTLSILSTSGSSVIKKEQEGRHFNCQKKRVKSPIRKGGPKLGKNGNTRCTPEGKKRRRSRVVEPVDLHSAG